MRVRADIAILGFVVLSFLSINGISENLSFAKPSANTCSTSGDDKGDCGASDVEYCEELIRFSLNPNRTLGFLNVISGDAKNAIIEKLKPGSHFQIPESAGFERRSKNGQLDLLFKPRNMAIEHIEVGDLTIVPVSGTSTEFDIEVPISELKMTVNAEIGGKKVGGLLSSKERPPTTETFAIRVMKEKRSTNATKLKKSGKQEELPAPSIKIRLALGKNGHLVQVKGKTEEGKPSTTFQMDLRQLQVESDPKHPMSQDVAKLLKWVNGAGLKGKVGEVVIGKLLKKALEDKIPLLIEDKVNRKLKGVLNPSWKLSQADLNRVRLQTLLKFNRNKKMDKVEDIEKKILDEVRQEVRKKQIKVVAELARKIQATDARSRYSKLNAYVKDYVKQVRAMVRETEEFPSEMKEELIQSQLEMIHVVQSAKQRLIDEHEAGHRKGKVSALSSQVLKDELEMLEKFLTQKKAEVDEKLTEYDLLGIKTVVDQVDQTNLRVFMSSQDCQTKPLSMSELAASGDLFDKSESDVLASLNIGALNAQLRQYHSWGLLKACFADTEIVPCGKQGDKIFSGELGFDHPPQMVWDEQAKKYYIAIEPKLKNNSFMTKPVNWFLKNRQMKVYLDSMGSCQGRPRSLCVKTSTGMKKSLFGEKKAAAFLAKTEDFMRATVEQMIRGTVFSRADEAIGAKQTAVPVQIDQVKFTPDKIHLLMSY